MTTILDASCAINLVHGDAIEFVLALEGRRWLIGPRVLEECEDDCGETVRSAVQAGRIHLIDDTNITASVFLDLLSAHGLGEGETECLAAARTESALVVATDDRKARTVATVLFGRDRLTGSLGLLRCCVATRLIGAGPAWQSYEAMLRAGGFLPRIDASFFEV